jgi:hypothetical protein
MSTDKPKIHTAQEVAEWFLAWNSPDDEDAEDTGIATYKLMTLVGVAQAFHFVRHGGPLFGTDKESCRLFLDPLNPQGMNYQASDFDFSAFTDFENQFLIQVWKHFHDRELGTPGSATESSER